MIGVKLYKPLNEETEKQYTEVAEWCNRNNATIEDKGDYYEVVEIVIPLDDIKTEKLTELKGKRDKRETAPIEYNDHLFDFDQKSYERITAAIYALDLSGGTIHWTTADNDTVEVSANDLRGVIANAAVRSNALHIKYRELKERVENATTKEQVEAISWAEEQ